MTKREWLERQGPWNLSAETIFSEFHALLECARQLADDADEERRRLKKVRERSLAMQVSEITDEQLNEAVARICQFIDDDTGECHYGNGPYDDPCHAICAAALAAVHSTRETTATVNDDDLPPGLAL